MNERDFCYWLQGLIEIGGVRPLEAKDVQIIADHLSLVFKKVTPPPYQGIQQYNPLHQLGQIGLPQSPQGVPNMRPQTIC